MLAKVVQRLPAPNGGGAALTRAAIGCQCPKISHAIPLRVFQILKSKRWNSAVFWVLQGVVGGELRAELVNMRTMAGRRARIVSNEPPDAGRVLACYRWGVTPDWEESTPSDRVESSRSG